jgi:moderate conductance mechanosensitive channel
MTNLLPGLSMADIHEILNLSRTPIHIILILLIAWGAYRVSGKAIRVFKAFLLNRATDHLEELKRIETLSRVFRYLFSIVITVVTGMLILSELGISIAPVLAAAGVLGIAIGFGAQSLVKDFFSGFFILLENQVRQGDVVEVAGKDGLVQEVTLRYIRLQDYEGNIHFIPNGNITTVTNKSREFAYAVIDLKVSYRADIEQVIKLMKDVGDQLREDEKIGSKILDDIEIAGVDDLTDTAVVIKCRFRVLPLEQWNVKREFLQRIKRSFGKNDIDLAFPRLTVFQGKGDMPATAAKPKSPTRPKRADG